MTIPSLRPYQLASLEAIASGLAHGSNRLLVKIPTGGGKTICFSALPSYAPIAQWLEQFPKEHRKMLIVAHREELLEQAAEKIQAANPNLMVMIEQGERRASIYADVVVASIQTLAAMKFRRLERFLARTTFRLVICDEAQHAPADTYRTLFAHLGFLPKADMSDRENIEAATQDDVEAMQAALRGWDQVSPKDRLLVGVTATPNRSDNIGLGCIFQSIAFSYNLRDAISDGWLVPIVPWAIETDTSLDAVHITRGDFNQRELSNTVNTPERNQLAIAAWREHAHRLPTIAFTVDVQHAHDMAAAFVAAGYRSRAVSGETPKDERRDILKRYTAGEIDVLSNCQLFTEGVDLPNTACIIMAKPTKSATLYEQCVGRSLRLFPGKTEAIIIDLVDVARRHSLQAAPVLYGLPPGLLVKGKKLSTLADDLDAFRELHPGFDVEAALAGMPLTLEALKARAVTFDMWAIPSLGAFGNGRALNWIRVSNDCYRLQYPWADGRETLTVSKDLLDQWELVLTLHPAEHGPVRQRTIAAQVTTADEAAGLAEAFILSERRSVAKLKDKDAPWRLRPASTKQLDLLKKKKVPIPKNATMGQCSDLLDLALAKRGR